MSVEIVKLVAGLPSQSLWRLKLSQVCFEQLKIAVVLRLWQLLSASEGVDVPNDLLSTFLVL